MSIYLYFAQTLDSEARRHQKLSELSSEPVIQSAHLDAMLALWAASDLLRNEARKSWRYCQKSEKKRRLSLSPLKRAYRKDIQGQ